MKFGDFCRVHTAPARYMGYTLGVFVSASDNELMLGPATRATGGEERFPQADDQTLSGMLRAYRYRAPSGGER